jgi:hypothetical protein
MTKGTQMRPLDHRISADPIFSFRAAFITVLIRHADTIVSRQSYQQYQASAQEQLTVSPYAPGQQ